MDEADVLGDRIGIMAEGKIVTCGSSLFLKNRFGVGYNLTIAKNSKEPNPALESFIKDKLEGTKKLSEISSEAVFQIPIACSHLFADFFSEFDRSQQNLGVLSYGISVTTLEEVFLRVGHGEIDPDDEEKIILKHEL